MKTQTSSLPTLSETFRLSKGDIVSLIGAGGKTTTMFRLAREQADLGLRVIVTTTTKIKVPEADDCDILILEKNQGHLLNRLEEAMGIFRRIVIGSDLTSKGKILGVHPELVSELAAKGDIVLVEADGGKGKSLKAPADYEPVIPESTTICVLIIGADIVGKPLKIEFVHRPNLVASLAEMKEGELITWESIRRVIFHPAGYWRKIPRGVRKILFFNKVSSGEGDKIISGVSDWDLEDVQAVVAGEALKVGRDQSFIRRIVK